MSDNVIRPEQWVANGEQSLTATVAEQTIEGGGGPPHDGDMERRISALEDTMSRLEPLMIRIDERTGYLATKEDVALVRSELALKASRVTVWTMGFSVAGLFIAALAAGAVYMPYLATLLRRSG